MSIDVDEITNRELVAREARAREQQLVALVRDMKEATRLRAKVVRDASRSALATQIGVAPDTLQTGGLVVLSKPVGEIHEPATYLAFSSIRGVVGVRMEMLDPLFLAFPGNRFGSDDAVAIDIKDASGSSVTNPFCLIGNWFRWIRSVPIATTFTAGENFQFVADSLKQTPGVSLETMSTLSVLGRKGLFASSIVVDSARVPTEALAVEPFGRALESRHQ